MSIPGPMPTHPFLTASHFQHTCVFCGCVFRVDITWCSSYSSKANQNIQDYACPECQRNSRIKTSTAPRITLISKRTDGRTSQCPTVG